MSVSKKNTFTTVLAIISVLVISFSLMNQKSFAYRNNEIEKNIIIPQTNCNMNILSKYKSPLKLNILERQEQKKNTIEDFKDKTWAIYIPKIDCMYDVFNDTSLGTLEKGIGHFEFTPKAYGNVCLAGHNIGKTISPFVYLFKLKKNDIVYYKYGNIEIKYTVKKKDKIKDTDFSYLENTNNDCLTLITCINGIPDKRLVVRCEKI